MKRLITNGLLAAFLLASTTQAAEPVKAWTTSTAHSAHA